MGNEEWAMGNGEWAMGKGELRPQQACLAPTTLDGLAGLASPIRRLIQFIDEAIDDY